jgi:hypothetical protein
MPAENTGSDDCVGCGREEDGHASLSLAPSVVNSPGQLSLTPGYG